MKHLIISLLRLLLPLCMNAQGINKDVVVEDAIPFCYVETKPKFKDKSVENFIHWVCENSATPDNKKVDDITGVVIVGFKVDEDGIVCDARILKGICSAVDTAILHTINSSPEWTPGQEKGKNVPIAIMIRICARDKNKGKIVYEGYVENKDEFILLDNEKR